MTRTRKKQTDQSVAWLTASLLELMDQQPLSKISVTAITNNAQLARRTFYRHFKSPQDLLTHEVDRFCSSFYHSLHSQAITTFPALVAIGQIPVIGPRRRRLTVREAARLQSFPEDFIPNPNTAQAYKQFGNAVNVEVIKLAARKLFLAGER